MNEEIESELEEREPAFLCIHGKLGMLRNLTPDSLTPFAHGVTIGV